jgi:hypothetical protein
MEHRAFTLEPEVPYVQAELFVGQKAQALAQSIQCDENSLLNCSIDFSFVSTIDIPPATFEFRPDLMPTARLFIFFLAAFPSVPGSTSGLAVFGAWASFDSRAGLSSG